MRRLTLGLSLTLLIAPAACSDLKPQTDPEADAQTSPPADHDDESVLTIAETPKVGDEFAGASVVQVVPVSECTRVVVEDPARWDCSERQILEAKAGGGARTAGVPAPEPSQPVLASQLQVSDCKGLANLRRPALKLSMQATLQSMHQQKLRDCLPTQRVFLFDKQGVQVSSCPSRGPSPTFQASSGSTSPGIGASAPSSAGSAGTPGSSAGASQYSTTNTQVVGVDEADFVKNDAQYVYILSQQGLHVIDAWPAKDSHEVKRLTLPGLGTRLFLHDSRLVVFVRPGVSAGTPSAAQACTYAYDCKFGAEPGRTTAIVYDVSNPASPSELMRYELSGGYVASRRVGSSVYTVVYDRPDAPQVPGSYKLDTSSPAAFETSYEQTRASLDAQIDAMEDAAFLPWVREARANSDLPTKISACDEALVAEAATGLSFTSVVTFDLTRLGAPHRSVIASKPGFVYASASALYMATEGADGRDGYYHQRRATDEISAVHKFSLDQVGSRYVGTATVRGHVLNQFALDELDGVLRVATTSGQVPDPNVSSNLTTFSAPEGKFGKLGELTGLAPTEDIRSVRFDGTRGFVVTFKKTDPLYVIDLSQPARPTVLGELKIPGFSTYMHPLDRDHLLALGFEADDRGSFAYFNGIQIQIFDIAQLSDPKLLHKTVIGTRGSASDALTNHLAFNYFAAKSLLALPMTICDGGGQGQYGDRLSFSGLMLYDISLSKGITERGRMPFVDQTAAAAVPSCSGWWTNTSSVVKRSIIMDDFAVGISDTLYKVAAIADLAKPLATLSLSTP